jgi:transposase
LIDERELPVLLKFEGMSKKEVAKALKIVNNYQEKLIEKWRTIHGDD